MPSRRATHVEAPVPQRTSAWSSFRRSRTFAALAMVTAGGLLGVMAYAPLGAAFASGPATVTADDGFATASQQLDASGNAVRLDDVDLVGAKAAPEPEPQPEPAEDAPAAIVPPSGPVDPGSAQAYAQSRMASYGWNDEQFSCLYALWMRESSWNYKAANPYSGAYGIPQALPGSKMATAGADWQTNPETQVDWGLGYISGRYGSPCAAWEHSEAIGWY